MRYIILLLLFSLTFLNAQIARVLALNGEVLIQRGNEFIPAELKYAIEEFDTIKTKNNSRIQLLFKDNTMISVGKNSSFSIEEYLYEVGKKPKASFNFGIGTFKTITGKIGKINPRGFKLKSKTASMGIRGTIVGLILTNKEELYLVPEGKIELKIGTKTIILSEGQMYTYQEGKVSSKPEKITIEIKRRFEKSSGAKENEEESGVGENTRTKSVNNVEKCNYR